MSEPTREEQINEVIAGYLRAVEAGEAPDPEDWARRHPELAGELRAFLADREAVLGTVRYFGDYELLGEVARGGMGVVYRARQRSLNRVVAVKMILAGQLASEQDVRRFRAEAEAAANLDHPNIVPIYEVGEHEGQHYFAMKLVEGLSLADELARRPAAGWDAAALRRLVAALAKVAEAVEHAHRRGVLHRDLKPANVLLDTDGTPLVTDFGLARRIDTPTVTQTGAIVGTPSYMSPEQARGEKGVTVATDVYALGAVLFEVVAGRPPFQAGTPIDTILQVLERDPSFPDGADRDLVAVCRKCLEKMPADRYESAREVADELRRWLGGEPVTARSAGYIRSRLVLLRRQPWRVRFFLFTTGWPALFMTFLVHEGRLAAWEAVSCFSLYFWFVAGAVLNPRWFLDQNPAPPNPVPALPSVPPPPEPAPTGGLRDILVAALQGAAEGTVLGGGTFLGLAFTGEATGVPCPWDSVAIPLTLFAVSALAFGVVRGAERLSSPLPAWGHRVRVDIHPFLMCWLGMLDLFAEGTWHRVFAWGGLALILLMSLCMVMLLSVWAWVAWRRWLGDTCQPEQGIDFFSVYLLYNWLPAAACAAARWLVVPWHAEAGFYILWQAALLGYAVGLLLTAATGNTRKLEQFWDAMIHASKQQ